MDGVERRFQHSVSPVRSSSVAAAVSSASHSHTSLLPSQSTSVHEIDAYSGARNSLNTQRHTRHIRFSRHTSTNVAYLEPPVPTLTLLSRGSQEPLPPTHPSVKHISVAQSQDELFWTLEITLAGRYRPTTSRTDPQTRIYKLDRYTQACKFIPSQSSTNSMESRWLTVR